MGTFFDDESCNVRSANPDSMDPEFASTVIDDGRNIPDLMLFDLENDENEYNDLLNGEGSGNKIFNHERKNKITDIKTQGFEYFYEPNNNIPVDTHLIDGVHKPWQSEDEPEFPTGYNY